MRLAAAALLALLLAPAAGAASADVTLEWADGAWNGASRVTGLANGTVRLWVPAEARLQSIEADGEPLRAWRAASRDAIEADPGNASEVVARFDLSARPLVLARVVAPQGYDHLVVRVLPPEGRSPTSPEASFAPLGAGGVAVVSPAPEGSAVTIRVVDDDRLGEVPILLSVGGLALVVLVVALAWHRLRPPLAGRAPERFLDHLAELQARLVVPAVLFALLNLFYFASGLRLAEVGPLALVVPTFGADTSLSARAFEAFAERLTPPGVGLVVLRPIDAVLAQVEMSLFLAFATVLPLLLYEVSSFIGPALTAKERRLAGGVVPLVAGLFVVGALVGYLLMAPLMIRTLYGYAPGLGAEPLLVVGDLVGFALLVMLAMGLSFELPVAMFVLSRLGLVKAATFRKYVRHAIVLIFILAGILTPDPSIVSQLIVALPVSLLYAVGIAAATLGERRRTARAG